VRRGSGEGLEWKHKDRTGLMDARLIEEESGQGLGVGEAISLGRGDGLD
jgi:hypothetical protein